MVMEICTERKNEKSMQATVGEGRIIANKMGFQVEEFFQIQKQFEKKLRKDICSETIINRNSHVLIQRRRRATRHTLLRQILLFTLQFSGNKHLGNFRLLGC